MVNIKGISFSWVIVKNLEQALNFYQKNLGFTLRNYDKSHGWAELTGMEGGVLGLSEENSQFNWKAGSNAIVTIAVENIMESRAELKAKGVKLLGHVIELPGEARLQSFLDLDGNLMQLIENKK